MKRFVGKKGSIKHLVVGGLLASLAIVFLLLWGSHRISSSTEKAKKDVWMTVFVHGSFGSVIGMVNFSEVLNDKISGTLYRQINKNIRDDDFFYRDQPILRRGLIRIEPTFDIRAIGNKKYAAYPIIKAYELINKFAFYDETNLFYTFGWSGLISQSSRRFEAIRFYNALSEEIKKLNDRDIFPKIRIISHSHGGNLCLNLAAVKRVLSATSWNEQQQFSDDVDENESLQKMLVLFKELSTQEGARNKKDQKVYDYVPVNKQLAVDELIMFGNPIQPETEMFCYNPMFKRVFNFYSEEDIIQKIDWVSTKKAASAQRVQKKPPSTEHAILYQVKIMTERSQVKPIDVQLKANDEADKKLPAAEQSFFDELFKGRGTKDPTHRELWCISWRQDRSPFFSSGSNNNDVVSVASFLTPLPVVILAPLMTKVLTQPGIPHDTSVNIRISQHKVLIDVLPLNATKPCASIQIPQGCITEIQEKIKPFKPDDLSWETEFTAVYKHLARSQMLLNK